MDQRITLRPPADPLAQNSFGETVSEFSDSYTVWAKVESMDGADLLRAQTFMSHLTIRMWIRYRANVTSEFQITWRDKVYNIAEILPHGRRVFLEMVCSEAK